MSNNSKTPIENRNQLIRLCFDLKRTGDWGQYCHIVAWNLFVDRYNKSIELDSLHYPRQLHTTLVTKQVSKLLTANAGP